MHRTVGGVAASQIFSEVLLWKRILRSKNLMVESPK
jgi:hypothetical protein